MAELTLVGARPYEEVRGLCHRIKECSRADCRQAAASIAPLLPDRARLIPAPSHSGCATNAFMLANELKDRMALDGKECTVLDILGCEPHEPFYDMKKRGEDISKKHLGVHVRAEAPKLTDISRHQPDLVFLVDNVVDTGTTARACMKALGVPGIRVVAVGDARKTGGNET